MVDHRPRTFPREHLHELVWSKPVRSLASEFNLSDVGLAKACKRADIPRPPRGYWAKLKVGKPVRKTPLPPRGFGMSHEVIIGNRDTWWRQPSVSDEKILSGSPEPPIFEDGLDAEAARAERLVGRVTVPKTLDDPHVLIRRLLEADAARREEALQSRWSSRQPLFDEPIEQRRLRLLNALFLALGRLGFTSSVRGKEARELSTTIGDQHVSFTLDVTSRKPEPHYRSLIDTRGPSTTLRLAIVVRWDQVEAQAWQDDITGRIERSLREVVVALIVQGERQYRGEREHHHQWLVRRKADLIEERRHRQEEAVRQEEARRRRLEKARERRLMADAQALRRAADIRAYVAAVGIQVGSENNDVWAVWSAWALAQADRIDPVASGRFVEGMRLSEDEVPVTSADPLD